MVYNMGKSFKAVGNKTVIVSLMEWSNEMLNTEEKHKNTLNYCSNFLDKLFFYYLNKNA